MVLDLSQQKELVEFKVNETIRESKELFKQKLAHEAELHRMRMTELLTEKGNDCSKYEMPELEKIESTKEIIGVETNE